MKELVTRFVLNLHREESGQDTIEYVLIGAAVVAALVAGTPTLTKALQDAIKSLSDKIGTALT